MFKKTLITALSLFVFLFAKTKAVFAQTDPELFEMLDNAQATVYGMGNPTPAERAISIFSFLNTIVFFIVSPIIFIVGLIKYILGKKQKNITKVKKGKKIMIIGIIISAISIIILYIYEKLI